MTKDMRRHYDALYKENNSYWGEAPSPLSLLLLPHVHGRREGRRLLDLGCGQGPDALFFARKGLQVVATDISPIAIDDLRRHAKDAGVHERIDARIADMNAPPDGRFDIVFSRMALQMIPAAQRKVYIESLRERYPTALHAHVIPITGACFGDDFICDDTLLADGYAGWDIILHDRTWTTSRVPNKKGEHYLMREAWIIARARPSGTDAEEVVERPADTERYRRDGQ